MKFYNTYYANNYEELLTYYPRFYRDVYEMVEILKAQGRIADKMEENIEQTYLNCFIDYADEPTLARLEQFLGIGFNKNRPLDERRKLVKSYFLGFGKLSATKIREMLGVFTDAAIDIIFINSTLNITFRHDMNGVMHFHHDIKKLLHQKVPAHILFLIYERYIGEYEISEKTETLIRFCMSFYPQFNLRPLHLDRTWKLDGKQKLSGYDGFVRIDLYPVRMKIQTKAGKTPNAKTQAVFLLKAKEKIESSQNIKTRTSVACQKRTGERVTIQTSAAVSAGTKEIMINNRNVLNGKWKLSGTRTLNGGIYKL